MTRQLTLALVALASTSLGGLGWWITHESRGASVEARLRLPRLLREDSDGVGVGWSLERSSNSTSRLFERAVDRLADGRSSGERDALRAELDRALEVTVEPGSRVVRIRARTRQVESADAFVVAVGQALVEEWESRERESRERSRVALVAWVSLAERRLAEGSVDPAGLEREIAAARDRIAALTTAPGLPRPELLEVSREEASAWREGGLALALALVAVTIAGAVFLLAELLRTRRVRPERLAAALNLELTACLADERCDPGESSDAELVALRGAAERLAESRGKPLFLAIASARAGDGRTSVSAALARSLAQSGARVVLVDASFRAPRLHEVFGISSRPGLTDLLDEAARERASNQPIQADGDRAFRDRTRSCLVSVESSLLRVLAIGDRRAHGVSRAADVFRVFEALRDEADYIVCDTCALDDASEGLGRLFETPDPRLISLDGLAVAEACGKALLVASSDTSTSQARWAAQLLTDEGVTLVGLVFRMDRDQGMERVPRNDEVGGTRSASLLQIG